jgi:hypothetical protein
MKDFLEIDKDYISIRISPAPNKGKSIFRTYWLKKSIRIRKIKKLFQCL